MAFWKAFNYSRGYHCTRACRVASRARAKRTCMQANGCRGRHIERLLPTWLADTYCEAGGVVQFRANTLPFVAEYPGTRPGLDLLLQQNTCM